jgi:hypothetical protein
MEMVGSKVCHYEESCQRDDYDADLTHCSAPQKVCQYEYFKVMCNGKVVNGTKSQEFRKLIIENSNDFNNTLYFYFYKVKQNNIVKWAKEYFLFTIPDETMALYKKAEYYWNNLYDTEKDGILDLMCAKATEKTHRNSCVQIALYENDYGKEQECYKKLPKE